MKLSFVRAGVAVALVAALAACGGKATFEVRGTVTGLTYSGLELVNGDQTLTVAPTTVGVPGQVSFAFPKSIDYGIPYDVKIAQRQLPDGTAPFKFPEHQSCVVNNGADTAGRLAEINVVVTCAINSYSVGGKVKGLTTDGLMLINGSDSGQVINKATPTATVPKPDVTFAFSAAVAYGVTYGITVFQQPTGQVCKVISGGAGTMGDAAVIDVIVDCV